MSRRVLLWSKRFFLLCTSSGYFALLMLRNGARRCFRREEGTSCVVLYYHGIAAEKASRFAAQMRALTRAARPVHLAQSGLCGGLGKCVAVTFDDSFVSFCDNGMPALVSLGIPVTLFVPSGCLGEAPPWLAGSDHPDRDDRVMTADELRRVPIDQVAIGSHTCSHAELTRLCLPDAEAEMRRSREQLEGLLGRQVKLFSFPNGAYNDELLAAAKRAGYERVFGIDPSTKSLGEGAFLVGRIAASPDDWPLEFWLKVRGAYSWLGVARRIKRRLTRIPARVATSYAVPPRKGL